MHWCNHSHKTTDPLNLILQRRPLASAEDDEDGSVADLDREEDGPTIVQLKEDDLSAEDVERHKADQKDKEERWYLYALGET